MGVPVQEDLAPVDPATLDFLVQADQAQEDLVLVDQVREVPVQEDLAPVDPATLEVPVQADQAQEDLVLVDPVQEDLAPVEFLVQADQAQEDLGLVDPAPVEFLGQADPAQEDLVLVDQVRQLRPLQLKLKSSTATMTQQKWSRSKSLSLIPLMILTPQRDGSKMRRTNGRKPTLLVNLELQHLSPKMAATGWSLVQKRELRDAKR